jgi:ABC-type sugar transport system permease subunit
MGWTFILPNFVGFALLTLIPIAALIFISFTKWGALGDPVFVGLKNYRTMFTQGTYWTALWNTVYYTIIHMPLTLVISLALALLLNQKMRGVAFFRTAAFFPYITSIVAIAVVWNLLFSPEYGPIDQMLSWLGVSAENLPRWTTGASPITGAMPAVIIVATWREMGYYMLLFLAGLQTIPPELYEAARMDGANSWQRFWNVTWPGLRPTTFFVTVMLTIGSFKVFDLILVMTEGGPGQATLVLSQLIYRTAIGTSGAGGDFGFSSAVAVSLFLICLTITIIQFLVNRRAEK